MNEEYFDIYNEKMEHIGIEKRKLVHKKGYWHKSFQCWFVFKEDNKNYILFQKRHKDKDTYPNLLDITSAGHLITGENIKDGIREIEEELGVKVKYEDLISLGIMIEQKSGENFIDNEFANVFLYNCKIPMENFKLQKEEVTGMFKIPLDEAKALLEGEIKSLKAKGYVISENEEKSFITLEASVNDFVPHNLSYYKMVFDKATDILTKNS